MNMSYLEQYNKIVNDSLTDGDDFKWKLHMSRMDSHRYTKTTTLQCGRFRFDIEYHSDKKFFYIFCRYDNNNRDYSNGTNRTVTLQQLRVDGNSNIDVYYAIREWKNNFLEEIKMIG